MNLLFGSGGYARQRVKSRKPIIRLERPRVRTWTAQTHVSTSIGGDRGGTKATGSFLASSMIARTLPLENSVFDKHSIDEHSLPSQWRHSIVPVKLMARKRTTYETLARYLVACIIELSVRQFEIKGQRIDHPRRWLLTPTFDLISAGVALRFKADGWKDDTPLPHPQRDWERRHGCRL